eukprot:8233889-Pyramimonas_sp.AAC.1
MRDSGCWRAWVWPRCAPSVRAPKVTLTQGHSCGQSAEARRGQRKQLCVPHAAPLVAERWL